MVFRSKYGAQIIMTPAYIMPPKDGGGRHVGLDDAVDHGIVIIDRGIAAVGQVEAGGDVSDGLLPCLYF